MERRTYTLKQLSDLVRGEMSGDGTITITGVARIEEAEEGDITFVAEPKYAEFLPTTRASAVIRGGDVECTLPSIVSDAPSLTFIEVLSLFAHSRDEGFTPGVHEMALVDPAAELGENVWVGPFCRISRGARIGANTRIQFGAFIGVGAVIGSDCLIYPNVTIREECRIGDRVIVHPGAVIGADGFGYVRNDERRVKIPQIGCVVIEDDVEIGANTTVDRATTGVTRICEGTKLDNLVHVAHNCTVGKNSVLAGQVGIAGSSKLGNGVVLGGQAGVADHLSVGDHVVVGARGGIVQSVDSGMTVSGFPARDHRETRRAYAYTARLPELYKRIRDLEKRIAELEKEQEHGEAAADDR